MYPPQLHAQGMHRSYGTGCSRQKPQFMALIIRQIGIVSDIVAMRAQVCLYAVIEFIAALHHSYGDMEHVIEPLHEGEPYSVFLKIRIILFVLCLSVLCG